ncbi:ABC transporter G family member 11 [Glycine max]|nr:ABC transporter G family member 11 [Glycine max]
MTTFPSAQPEVLQTNPQVLTTFEGDAIKLTEINGSVQREKDITVTWENLWVTVSSGKKKKPILQDLTGYARPGRILAIMGPSGCGKSTLLDALAGRLSTNIKHTGKILINGQKQALAYGTSGYVTQDDAMLSTLTTGETLYYSAQLQFPDSMSIAEKKERADMTLREMGLQDAINTRVGGWGSKGLSGGQKRRLSICIEILTRPRLLFLDEPTSGLDSAASYYVMSRIASLNLRDGIRRTIVASIHQPSSEIFELFHDLCLLSSGETVYFGPASDANQFFASNGFPCPTLHNPSDHYLRIINKDFEQDAEQGFGKGVISEKAIDNLVKSYKSSQIRKQVKKEVNKIGESDSDAIRKQRIHAAFPTQCLVLIRRASLQLFRDISNYWLRLIVFIVIAISIGSIFYDIGTSNGSIQGRGSLFIFFVSVLTFMTLVGGFSPLLEEIKVFERERLNGHYGVTAFLIGNIFSAVPYMLLISLIPGGIAYYLCGMHKGPERFFYFTSLLFAIVMWVESLMLVVGSICPNYVIGMFLAGGVEGLMILTGGFYRLPNDLPKPLWKYPLYYKKVDNFVYLVSVLFASVTWVVESLMMVVGSVFPNYVMGVIVCGGIEGVMILTSGFYRLPNDLPKPVWKFPFYYISFLTYAFQGLLKNEFEDLPFSSEVLADTWHVQMGHSKWVDLAIMFGMILLCQVLYSWPSVSARRNRNKFMLALNPKQKFSPESTSIISDCEPNNSSKILPPLSEFETSFEVEKIKSVETGKDGEEDQEEGVFLTWEDLWVTVSNGKNGRKPILQGLKGYAKPGKLLAIMGPSGCGKSTLLDALAGRLGSKTKQTGKILINGRKQALAYGASAYVTEDDTILTTLTVKEAVYYSAYLQLPDSMSKSEKQERADFTIREMGLHDAINTRIGGWGSKGASGGQKRRVSICIEILTHPRLLFLDEPTSGLDSAASYHVMSRISNLNKKDGIQRTIIASIHQPSNEIFQLFHNLCLLSSGKTVYFGPTSAANKFFSSNGFPCPSLHSPSDHFVKTINKDFEQDPEKGLAGGLSTEEAIHVLAKSYDSSKICHQVQKEIAQTKKRDSDTMDEKCHADFFTQCLILTRRSFVNMYREVGYYWLRLLIYGALALSLGTMFFDIGSSSESIQARGSLLVFVVTFLTFITVGGFPSFVEEMKVFERERLNGHYGVTAFTIGNTLSSVPFLLLMSLIPGALVYYLVGLHQGHEHFVYFIFMLFTSVFLVEGLMMIVASMVPNFLMGIIVGSGILGIMMLDGGFYRLPSDIPKPFWRYPLHYISFHKYAYQGLFKNEFQGLTFPSNQVGAHMTIHGEHILRHIWQMEVNYSKWVDVGILVGMAVLYRILFLVIIKSFEKVKPISSALNCPQTNFGLTKVTRSMIITLAIGLFKKNHFRVSFYYFDKDDDDDYY